MRHNVEFFLVFYFSSDKRELSKYIVMQSMEYRRSAVEGDMDKIMKSVDQEGCKVLQSCELCRI